MTHRNAISRALRSLAVPLLAAALVGCSLPARQPPDDPAGTNTAQTVEAALTLAAEAFAATTPAPPTEEAPPTPTPTPPPSPTLTPTTIPCDRAAFVADVNFPDGTDVLVGAAFTKTWRLRNNGTCTWTSGYALVFSHGDSLGGPATVSFPAGTVAPGQTVDLSVSLTAPLTTGTYRGYWRLRNPAGGVFGIGPAGDGAFWVEIDAISAAPTGPAFDVAFENVHLCGGTPFATFRVGNTGGVGLESARIEILDLTASTTLYGPFSNDTPFNATASDCPPGASAMGPGSVYFIAASIGSPAPSGHSARLNLRLCTANALGGDCVDRTVNFTVP